MGDWVNETAGMKLRKLVVFSHRMQENDANERWLNNTNKVDC